MLVNTMRRYDLDAGDGEVTAVARNQPVRKRPNQGGGGVGKPKAKQAWLGPTSLRARPKQRDAMQEAGHPTADHRQGLEPRPPRG